MKIKISDNLFEKWKSDGKILEKSKGEYYCVGYADRQEMIDDFDENKEKIENSINDSFLVDIGSGWGNHYHKHIMQFSEEGNSDSRYQTEFTDFNSDVSIETISKYTAQKSLEVGKVLVYLRTLS